MNFFDPSLAGLLWVLAIGLTVLVLDVFFETEILSIAALLGISVYVSLWFDLDVKWRVLAAILCFFVVVAIFYTFWKRLAAPMIRGILPSGHDESIRSAPGDTAEFRLIDGHAFVSWNGDLWPVEVAGDGDVGAFEDHEKVLIEAETNGVFTITHKPNRTTLT